MELLLQSMSISIVHRGLNMKIYASNLDPKTTETELRTAFTNYGEVADCCLNKDKATNKTIQQGWAEIQMENATEGNAAIKGLEGTRLGSQTIRVSTTPPPAAAASASAGASTKH